jgi:NAD(P)H-dependent FMN reductase
MCACGGASSNDEHRHSDLIVEEDNVLNVGIIIGSTRPGRKAADIGHWIHGIAAQRSDASFEVVDIADFNLPLLDEAYPPSMGKYARPHTTPWAAKIAGFDAFVFVTPEYNHSTSGALKNAIDYLFREWNDKAAGFVGYGAVGGVRAVEHLRLIMGELKVADVRAQVALTLFTDFENFSVFKPAASQELRVKAMLDDLIPWARALQALRSQSS